MQIYSQYTIVGRIVLYILIKNKKIHPHDQNLRNSGVNKY